jgi:hypothetical protein
MKRFLAVVAVLGLVAMPVMAEMHVTVTPLGGTVTPLTAGNSNRAGGTAVDMVSGVIPGGFTPALHGATVVYSNNPLLGTSTIPTPTLSGPFGTPVANTYLGIDWVTPSAKWTDYINMTQAGTITTITYLYSNGAGANTQTIVIGAGPPLPSVSGAFTGIGVIASITGLVLPGGAGFFQASITGLSIPVPSNIYIGYEDAFGVGPGTGSTFWFNGGFPLIGASSDANAFWVPTSPYSYAVQGPFAFGPATPPPYFTVAAHANILQTVVMPEPMTIGLVAVGGLLALRRRRAA